MKERKIKRALAAVVKSLRDSGWGMCVGCGIWESFGEVIDDGEMFRI